MIHSLALMPLLISIHAPTRGATTGSGNLFGDSIISIHAPTRGATLKIGGGAAPIENFNPRSHEGSDVQRGKIFYSLRRFQSTLPRGERPQYRTIIHSIVYFNPRSHEGSDGNMLLQLLSTVISIHAPTRGATSAVLLLPVATSNFNPRSHEGSDAYRFGL